jgi:elongation factor G
VEGECVKHAGAAGGLFAKVTVELEPYHGEEPVLVTARVKPDELPPAYLAAAEQGILGALGSGELGYPVMNVKATVVGGQVDEELSNETAFQAAGADAVHKAMRDNVALLEPWMKLLVEVPAEYVGSVVADIGARRGEIYLLDTPERVGTVGAHVPLAGMFDYADKVRSLSQGRASSTMEPYAYKPAPDEVLQRLLHPEDFY